MISTQESRTRGLILHGLSSLMGEVARGVIKSNSRMKDSVLFHEKEEEKKLNAARGEHTKLKKQMETREKKVKENEEKSKGEIAHLKKELEQISVDRDKFRADKDHVEGQLKVNSESLKRKESENLEMKGKVDRVQKKLEN